MKFIYFFLILIVANFTLFAQNVMISNSFYPNETSIKIDPKHPNVMIAGANLNNYYISIDSGFTWTEQILTSSFGVWGDPVVDVDTSGSFYYFHLSNPTHPDSIDWIDRIVCQKTTDIGNTWSDGSYAGLNGTKEQDKQWSVVDRTNNNIYLTWTQFDLYASENPLDSTTILFSKSTDAGISWSTPKRINTHSGNCIDSDNTVEGAVPCVGPNGEIYVSWAGPNGLVFNKSADQGETWLDHEISVSDIPGGWDFAVSGIYRANGLPITACDISNGPNRGTIYINWSDQRNGESNTDIWLSKSTDAGQTWSNPIKVNDDETDRQQFFTWMTIDQTTGYLYFVFYDRRNYSDDSTDVYLALSTDGGNTFINKKISQSPFYPTPEVFFGDYTNIDACNGVIRPIWTRLNNGQLSVWTDITRIEDFSLSVPETSNMGDLLNFENYPNPACNYSFVSFKLHNTSNINLSVIDVEGNVISRIIENEKRGYGKYVERIDLCQLNIPSGVYFLRLEIDNKVKTMRQIVVR